MTRLRERATVDLVRLDVALVRDLVAGTLERPGTWHPQYPTADTFDAAQLLLGAYAALGEEPDARTAWWLFAVVVEGTVVGDAGFHGPPPESGPPEVEIGYQVVPALRGRGVATRACALLLAHAWRHGAAVVRADAEPENVASRAVLRANGFRLTARGDFAVAAPASAAT